MDNFDSIVQEVISWFGTAPLDAQSEFLSTPKEQLVRYHTTLGRSIRNEFGLWQNKWEPEINHQGVDCSPNHPDEVSMRVIETVWERLHEDS